MDEDSDKYWMFTVKYAPAEESGTTVITNVSLDRLSCDVTLEWDDEEGEFSHDPVVIHANAFFDEIEEIYIGRAQCSAQNSWHEMLSTNLPAAKTTYSENMPKGYYFVLENGNGDRIPIVGTDPETETAAVSVGMFPRHAGDVTENCYYTAVAVYVYKDAPVDGFDLSVEVTIKLKRIDQVRTHSIELQWENNPPKPAEVTAQLLVWSNADPLQEWIVVQEVTLNEENHWSQDFQPIAFDGDDRHYWVDLLDGDGNRIRVNATSPYSLADYDVTDDQGIKNRIAYRVRVEKQEDGRYLMKAELRGRKYYVNKTLVNSPISYNFLSDEWPEATVILQHRENGTWTEYQDDCKVTVGLWGSNVVEFRTISAEVDNNFRIRELNENGEATEDNGIIRLHAKIDETPLHLQYRVNYGEQDGAADADKPWEFPLTNTLIGQVFPVEVVWDGQAADSVKLVLQSSLAGANEWAAVGGVLELSAQNEWRGWLGPVAYEECREYRVRELRDDNAPIDEGMSADIGGNRYTVSYAMDDKGRITVTNAQIKYIRVYMDWQTGDLGNVTPEPVTVVLQHLEAGNWVETARQALSLEGEGEDELGADWRFEFILPRDADENYRVRELDMQGNPVEPGGEVTYRVEANEGVVQELFTADYQVHDAEKSVDITNTYTVRRIELTANVVWDDHNDQDGKRPLSVDVTLVANGDNLQGTKHASQGNGWNFSFADKPKYANGLQIHYTVEQEHVDNYITAVAGYIITTVLPRPITRFPRAP